MLTFGRSATDRFCGFGNQVAGRAVVGAQPTHDDAEGTHHEPRHPRPSPTRHSPPIGASPRFTGRRPHDARTRVALVQPGPRGDGRARTDGVRRELRRDPADLLRPGGGAPCGADRDRRHRLRGRAGRRRPRRRARRHRHRARAAEQRRKGGPPERDDLRPRTWCPDLRHLPGGTPRDAVRGARRAEGLHDVRPERPGRPPLHDAAGGGEAVRGRPAERDPEDLRPREPRRAGGRDRGELRSSPPARLARMAGSDLRRGGEDRLPEAEREDRLVHRDGREPHAGAHRGSLPLGQRGVLRQPGGLSERRPELRPLHAGDDLVGSERRRLDHGAVRGVAGGPLLGHLGSRQRG